MVRKGKGQIRKGNPPTDWKVSIMTKFNFTADELNKILGWSEAKHSTRWNRLRNKFAVDMDEDLFNEVYRAFYEGSTGIITTPAPTLISDKEAETINFLLKSIARADFPISFSDVFFSDERIKKYRATDRDRAQKIIDLLEKSHKVEGLRVIRIMTQGTCHIKLYEIR